MKKETWIEIVVGGIILTMLGWGGTTLFEINGTLATIRAELGWTTQRVDRIVNEVPTLRRQIAQSQVTAPASQAVVATVPVRRDSATSVAAVHVLDFKIHKTTSYYITLTNKERDWFSSTVHGAVSSSAPSALTFGAVMESMTDTAGAYTVPAFVDVAASFVIWSRADTLPSRAVHHFIVGADSSKTQSLRLSEFKSNWSGIVAELQSHPKTYTVAVERPIS